MSSVVAESTGSAASAASLSAGQPAQAASSVEGVCAAGCGQAAKQSCPTCLELKLTPTRFCSQECFKKSWKEHNTAVHKPEKERLNFRPPPFDYTGSMRPAWISPKRFVPAHIERPNYAVTGEPLGENLNSIHINTAAEIKGIRAACKIGRQALDLAHSHCKPGVTTDEIDRVVHEFIIANNAYPSPLNYRFFPKSCCTSVNEVICFGEDTRVLTNIGFKFIGEIEQHIEAGTTLLYASYQINSDSIAYRPGRLLTPPNTTGKLIEFQNKSNHLDLRVTPNHRMFVQTGREKIAGNQAVSWSVSTVDGIKIENAYRMATASELYHEGQCPAGCPGGDRCKHKRYSCRMLACASAGLNCNDDLVSAELSGALGLEDADQVNAFLEVYGFWLGDGSMFYQAPGHGFRHAVVFSQIKRGDVQFLRRMLPRCGLKADEWTETVSGAFNTFKVRATRWVLYFDAEYGRKYKARRETNGLLSASAGPAVAAPMMDVLPAAMDPPATAFGIAALNGVKETTRLARLVAGIHDVLEDHTQLIVGAGRFRPVKASDPCGVVCHLLNPISKVFGEKEDGRPAYTFSVLESAAEWSSVDTSDGWIITELTPLVSEPDECSSMGSLPVYSAVWQSSIKTVLLARAPVVIAFGDKVQAAWLACPGISVEGPTSSVGSVSWSRKKVGDHSFYLVHCDHPSWDDAMASVSVALAAAASLRRGDIDGDGVVALHKMFISVKDVVPDPKSAKWFWHWALRKTTTIQARFISEGLRRADGCWANDDNVIYTSSVSFRDELIVFLLHAGYSAFFNLQHRAGDVKGYSEGGSEIKATVDGWRVCYAEPTTSVGKGQCWPSINVSQRVKEVAYAGRVWCVDVGGDHLIVAQRAKRDDAGVVVKASRPVIVGNCHGIPDARPLEDGDILNVDISVYYKGFHSDLNETFTVGTNVDPKSKELIRTTYDCLMKSIEAVRPGAMFRDFGEIITKTAGKAGFSVVRSYCGHGVGAGFHTPPSIPHYARNKAVGSCRPGMVFTIEPMINMGTWKDVTWGFDDWTSVTTDGKRSAQFEHTMLVTEKGVEVLTARTKDSPPLWWEVEEAAAAAASSASTPASAAAASSSPMVQ